MDDIRDVGEALEGVLNVVARVQIAADLAGIVRKAQRIAVALRLDDLAVADPVAAAGHVADFNVDAQLLRQVLRRQTGRTVHSAAGTERADDGDVAIRPLFASAASCQA